MADKLRTAAKLISVLVCILCGHAVAGEKIRVQVIAAAGFTAEGAEMWKSYVDRELRSLGDVEVVDTKPMFVFRFDVFGIQGTNATVIYAVATTPTSCGSVFLGVYHAQTPIFYVGQESEIVPQIRETYAKLVTDFDIHVLAPYRKLKSGVQ